MNILDFVKDPINYLKLVIFGRRIGEKINEFEKRACEAHWNDLRLWIFERRLNISKFKKIEKEIDECKFCLPKFKTKEEENEFRRSKEKDGKYFW